MTREEYFQKLAYSIGRQQAYVEETEKQAVFGGSLGNFARSAWNLGKNLWSGAYQGAQSGLGTLGKSMISPIKDISPGTYKWLRIAGGHVPRDMVGFGLFGGGINALMADPGDRMSAFGKGFAGGALGGAAWRGASNVIGQAQRSAYRAMHGGKLYPNATRQLVRFKHPETGKMVSANLFKPGKGLYGSAQGNVFKSVKSVEEASKAHTAAGKSWFTNPERWYNRFNEGAAKRIGSKAAIGAVPVAGAFAASAYTPSFEGENPNMGAAPQPQYQNPYSQQWS